LLVGVHGCAGSVLEAIVRTTTVPEESLGEFRSSLYADRAIAINPVVVNPVRAIPLRARKPADEPRDRAAGCAPLLPDREAAAGLPGRSA
jgi:hypothetical protein